MEASTKGTGTKTSRSVPKTAQDGADTGPPLSYRTGWPLQAGSDGHWWDVVISGQRGEENVGPVWHHLL